MGSKRLAAAVLAACGAMLLAGCLLMPGKFAATLELKRGGTFAYRYDGEIHLLALSKLAEMGRSQGAEEFAEQPCYDEDSLEEHPCTDAEKAEQRRTWDEGAAERKERQEREAESMRAMLGGIDPADPKAAEELAARLRRQVGWNRVDYKGDGLFDVSFALSGRIDHDFLFPTLEGFPMSNFFVLVSRRSGGTVRVDAPGFAPQASGNPFQGMMGPMMAGAAAGASGEEGAEMAKIPTLDGTFTIVTDGEILANNTDEGAVAGSGGKTLTWPVNVRTKQAPMALINLN
jgi:hypothetical protein